MSESKKVVIARKACGNVVINDVEIPNSKVLYIKMNNDHSVNVVVEIKANEVYFAHSKPYQDSIDRVICGEEHP